MGCFDPVNIVPIEARLFEDCVDGYFPLSVTLAHLLQRQCFGSALIAIRVAPMMDIPNLESGAPVPLHINPLYSGQIDWLVAVARMQPLGSCSIVSGWAQWHWNDRARDKVSRLPHSLRLAEPAYVHGIGFVRGHLRTRSLGRVKLAETSSCVALHMPNIDLSDFSTDVPQFDAVESLCWSLNPTYFLEWFDHSVVGSWGCRYSLNLGNGSEELLLVEKRCEVIWRALISDTRAYTKRSFDAVPA